MSKYKFFATPSIFLLQSDEDDVIDFVHNTLLSNSDTYAKRFCYIFNRIFDHECKVVKSIDREKVILNFDNVDIKNDIFLSDNSNQYYLMMSGVASAVTTIRKRSSLGSDFLDIERYSAGSSIFTYFFEYFYKICKCENLTEFGEKVKFIYNKIDLLCRRWDELHTVNETPGCYNGHFSALRSFAVKMVGLEFYDKSYPVESKIQTYVRQNNSNLNSYIHRLQYIDEMCNLGLVTKEHKDVILKTLLIHRLRH